MARVVAALEARPDAPALEVLDAGGCCAWAASRCLLSSAANKVANALGPLSAEDLCLIVAYPNAALAAAHGGAGPSDADWPMMSRGTFVLVLQLGVLRAGAAFAVLECDPAQGRGDASEIFAEAARLAATCVLVLASDVPPVERRCCRVLDAALVLRAGPEADAATIEALDRPSPAPFNACWLVVAGECSRICEHRNAAALLATQGRRHGAGGRLLAWASGAGGEISEHQVVDALACLSAGTVLLYPGLDTAPEGAPLAGFVEAAGASVLSIPWSANKPELLPAFFELSPLLHTVNLLVPGEGGGDEEEGERGGRARWVKAVGDVCTRDNATVHVICGLGTAGNYAAFTATRAARGSDAGAGAGGRGTPGSAACAAGSARVCGAPGGCVRLEVAVGGGAEEVAGRLDARGKATVRVAVRPLAPAHAVGGAAAVAPRCPLAVRISARRAAESPAAKGRLGEPHGQRAPRRHRSREGREDDRRAAGARGHAGDCIRVKVCGAGAQVLGGFHVTGAEEEPLRFLDVPARAPPCGGGNSGGGREEGGLEVRLRGGDYMSV